MHDFLRQDANRQTLWLDYSAYAGRLLANGEPPWLDVAGLIAWQRKAQDLLRSDVITLPLARVCAVWLSRHPDLCLFMAARKRPLHPLRALLGDDRLRARLAALLAALRACFSGKVLALLMPSPRRWLELAQVQAFGTAPARIAGGEAIDAASVVVADFLGPLGVCGIDVLLLQEAAGSEPADAKELEWYRPVLNLAAQQRICTGLMLPHAVHDPGRVDGLAFAIAPRALSLPTAVSLDPSYWQQAALPLAAAGAFRHAEIPVDARPEQVLEGLARLRAEAASPVHAVLNEYFA